MSERILIRLLREISSEEQIKLTVLSYGWLFRLEKSGVVRHIYGNNFDIDLSATQKIVSDKAATSEILDLVGIPHVEHRLFFNPDLENYCSPAGVWQDIMTYAQTFDYKVVCKSTSGSGGSEVFFCEDNRGLEQATQKIFANKHGLVLCPYYEAEKEYRLIMLDGECEIAYSKQKAQIVGNGYSSFLELLSAWAQKREVSTFVIKNLVEENRKNLQYVPIKNETIKLSSKHNLSKGALPQTIEKDTLQSLEEIAKATTKALNVRFSSVDILETQNGFKVLEVNSGVMMDNYIRLLSQGYEQAKELYCKVILRMFEN